MREFFARIAAAGLLAAALPVDAIDSNVPPAGLPSASSYSATLLPELDGVVSWKTLGEVEPVKRDGKMVPQFSDKILGLDGKSVRVQGFILPMDLGEKQKHFLISAVPPHCPFCLPAGPDAIVEVYTRKPIAYSMEPILVTGKLAVLPSDPSGVLYRLTDAEPIAARPK
jgi:hypothetical protein